MHPDSRAGHSILVLRFEGVDLSPLHNEAGGHRAQRVPPTERRGRVHSSTVTVAIIDAASRNRIEIDDRDLRIEWFSGSGAGGQHRNKHQNCCRLIHAPTGLVRAAQMRSRDASYAAARAALAEDLAQACAGAQHRETNDLRRLQLGSGERGDKKRTWRWQDDSVLDHVTGRRARLEDVLKGGHATLWA